MPVIPAFCEACGLVFNSPAEMENSSNVSFKDIGVVCPRCSAVGEILDGVYSTLGNTIQILATSQRSSDSLRKLANALRNATGRNASPEEIKATFKEHAPELSHIADVLPTNRKELYAFITAICAVIGALALLFPFRKEITEQQRSEIVDQAVQKMITQSAKVTAPVSSPMNRAQRRARGRPPRRKAPHK